MATVYEIKLEVVSDFCRYSEEEMKQIVEMQINNFKSKHGLKVYVTSSEVAVKA